MSASELWSVGARSRPDRAVRIDPLDALPDPARLLDAMGAPLDPAVYDWAHARDQELTPEERFQLTYAAEVEWGTEGTFASLDISRDPVVRRFLRVWLNQETVHAQLLVRFLTAHDITVQPRHRARHHRVGAQRGRRLNQLARLAVGDDFFAVHMVWGAVNELTTLRFYTAIRARTQNHLLRVVLRDVIAQEAQHYAFYRTVGSRRLTGNRRAQRIVRWALEHLWTPVGVGLRTPDDANRLLLGVFGDRPDQITHMDRQLNQLPGLAGLDLIDGCLRRAQAG